MTEPTRDVTKFPAWTPLPEPLVIAWRSVLLHPWPPPHYNPPPRFGLRPA